MRVLVAYATAEGSTTGVAERIGTVLRRSRHDVDVLPVGDVTGVEDYDTVVLGSAVHDQRWLPEASRFLAGQRASLARRSLWAFSVGMPDAFRSRARDWVRTEADDLLDDVLLQVEPHDHQLFSGVVRPAQFEWWRRALFRLAGGRFGDFRDGAAIDRWAGRIARTPEKSR
ncbi:menaquinone-dependent protoporphyrinogen oxidase [Saccharothrix ecbatanensis]|uniref:Menaquinone-dependent protoporphyrinogen oxidase n=1 Tax=Saccharothrix ecbatanensis TaxID=1105145 RepID=A0A7W9LYW3_9PSEU|nr:flavodoxin domain-containing protein [Saccharothrix ecbatanensis]MBB5801206.1 menaquinone-dependent protoporphyrinogen oxidase [Saccharothrix ecbatanensis]